jgi:hypothetical protein
VVARQPVEDRRGPLVLARALGREHDEAPA